MKQIIIIGECYTALLEKKLETLGLLVLPLPDNPDISPKLAGHTDMSVFYPGKREIFLSKYLMNTPFVAYLRETNLTVRFIEEKQSADYPSDVPLNARMLYGNKAILNKRTVSGMILQYFCENNGFEIMDVNQGYSACAVLDCGDGIITSDNGICQAVRRYRISILKISPGYISLPGYNYGFIGGSAFKLGNKMVFTGSLKNHPDRERIIQFLSEHYIEPFYLTDDDVFDIGGAVLITP